MSTSGGRSLITRDPCHRETDTRRCRSGGSTGCRTHTPNTRQETCVCRGVDEGDVLQLPVLPGCSAHNGHSLVGPLDRSNPTYTASPMVQPVRYTGETSAFLSVWITEGSALCISWLLTHAF